MNTFTKTVELRTFSRCQMLDITARIAEAVSESGIAEGSAAIFCPHTTAAVTINENADPDVVHDMLMTLEQLLPKNRPGYRHTEGNSDAHIKSSLIGCTQNVIITKGKLLLGTWQGIYFCEFDGPRTRTLNIQIIG